MNDFHFLHKQQEKRNSAYTKQNKSSEGIGCRHCGAIIPLDAELCPECKYPVHDDHCITFEKKIKKLVMPTLMQAIPGFYWQEASAVSSFELDNSMIFPSKNKYADKKFDDCFVGEYRNVPVAVSEYRYVTGSGKNKQIIFQGAVIKIKMNKNFEGTTIIRPRRAPNGNF